MSASLKLDTHQKAVLSVGVVLLIYAVLCALSGQIRGSDLNTWQNFYLHYGEGYVNRGFIGTLFRLFFGELETAEMSSLVNTVDFWLTAAEICFLWILLVPRIALARSFSPMMRWLLMAFVAIVLLSPIWKMFATFIGTMDKWIYLFVLSAVAALVFRRPVAFAVFLIISLLVHRGGIFYASILVLFVWHAVWRIPAFRQRRVIWIVASVMPIVTFFVLQELHDADRVFLVYAQSKIAHLYDVNRPGGSFGVSAAGGGGINDILYIFQNGLIFYKGVILGFLFYAGPIIAAAALFCWSCARAGLGFGNLSQPYSRLAAFAKRTEILLPMAATMAPLPINLFAYDLSRFIYWCWLGLALALVYHVWFFRTLTVKRKKKKKTTQHKTVMPLKLTIAGVAFSAFVFAGSPLIVAWLTEIVPSPCVRWCAITNHSPGNFLLRGFLKIMVPSFFPYHIDAAKYPESLFPHHHEKIDPWVHREVRDGRLWVPGDYDGKIYRQVFYLYKGSTFYIDVAYGYDNKDALPFELSVNYSAIPSTKVEGNRAQWVYTIPQEGRYEFILRALGDDGFFFDSYSMDVKPAKRQY